VSPTEPSLWLNWVGMVNFMFGAAFDFLKVGSGFTVHKQSIDAVTAHIY
jgi:hypothetical protein